MPLTDAELASIERRLSTERLQPYLHLAAQDRHYALQLYQWNTAVSAAFYAILQGFEIAFRNTFHETLAASFGRADWYSVGVAPLTEEGRRIITDAETRLRVERKARTPGHIVAELSFGFWVSLMTTRYAQTLWDNYLHKSFNVPLARSHAYHALDRIRKLRNRVAHHEIIIGRKLMDDYGHLFQCFTWICPDTAKWVKTNSQFVDVYKRRPVLAQVPVRGDGVP